jgi:hypothetical protein
MSERIRGSRPQPRVAVIGEFELSVLEQFRSFFPTIWEVKYIEDLQSQVNSQEIDLIILGSNLGLRNYQNYVVQREYLSRAHIISFSYVIRLPGPINGSECEAFGTTDTEQYSLPDLPLMFNRQRDQDLAFVTGIRGWKKIEPNLGEIPITKGDSEETVNKTLETIFKGIKEMPIVLETLTQDPLATIYRRETTGLFIAWLPNEVFNQATWVEIICSHIADTDRQRFPNFGNWQKMPEWMTKEEIALESTIKQLNEHRLAINREIDEKITLISQQEVELNLAVNRGRRRLITSQGSELVEEVASVFREFGFIVRIMDDEVDQAESKREDLRLTMPDNPHWAAIVEVRGYGRGSSQNGDFQRLGRFAMLYFKECGRPPDQRILVVNGEIEIKQPSRRQIPYAAAEHDLEEFAKDDGLVIWSLDLYRQVNREADIPAHTIRNSVINARGRWRGV